MAHVVTNPSPPFLALDGALEVHQIPDASDNLVWVARCTQTGAAAAVDGPGAKAALAYCEVHGIELTAVFNTHTHGDHIGINHGLARLGLLDGMRVVGSALRADDVPGLTESVVHGDAVRLGEVQGRVMLTEGHINGHISFVFGDVVFCGDTMFAAGCGYLFDGPPQKMFDSLMALAALDPNTRVCCAHEYTQDNLRFAWSIEPDNAALADRIRQVWAIRTEGRCTVPSTIEVERATNPFLRPGSPSIRAVVQAAFPARDLSTPAAVFAGTRALKDTKAYRSISEEELPLEA